MLHSAFETTAVSSKESAHFLREAVGVVILWYVTRQTSFLSSNLRRVIISNVTSNQRMLINDATCLTLKVTEDAGNQVQLTNRSCKKIFRFGSQYFFILFPF